MPILAIFTGKGMTKEMYEALLKEIKWEQEHPAGGVFHVAAFDESGSIHVADVWESAEAMNTFVETKLMPAMKKLNVPPPTVEVYPVHKVAAYSKNITKYTL